MSNLQEEAVRAVSAALSDSTGELLTAIDSAQEQWQQELDTANSRARKLLATVLVERESLRTSLGTAAELWRILRPSEPQRQARQSRSEFSNAGLDTKSWHQSSGFVADEEQLSDVRALQNVSHTIFYLEFLLAAPDALKSAREALLKLSEEKLDQVVAGNAAILVESHAVLTAIERLRDLIMLEAESTAHHQKTPSLPWFEEATQTRALLENIVLGNIFSNIVIVSQKNPRLLVSAARIVESEEAEDEWWNNHLLRGGKKEFGGSVRPFGSQQYRKRALDAVVQSLQALFRQKEKDLGLQSGFKEEVKSGSSLRSLSSPMEVVNIIDWIEHRRSENDTVRRFVAPCLPPSFAIGVLYEKELHRQFMRLITRILHLVNADGSMMLSEPDLILLTSWYCKYREEVGDHNEAIDSFLSDRDRERLISALQKHCASRISTKITSAIALDRGKARSSLDIGIIRNEDAPSTQAQAEAVLRRSDLPDVVLGCINEQVRRMLALKIQGMDQAIAETAADCLISFQNEIHNAMLSEEKEASEECYRLYACATANNMARCLEYSEDLRDLFIPLASDKDRSDIEERMERVIEGFRIAASRALKALINGMDSRLRAHASRLYAPYTGTEIMLDIVATLEDYFSDYEAYLLPYHFEHLAIESLKRVVIWYLVPFLRLGQNRMEESSARRFTSLPTFGEMSSMSVDMPPEDCDAGLFSRHIDRAHAEKDAANALQSLDGAAVVAQIEKDRANLTEFMAKKVVLYQKKQLQPTLEPLQAIRSLYTCPSTTFGLSDAFRDAKNVIGRALRPPWVSESGVSGHVSVRIAEVIWESRQDVNPVVLLEAINVVRSLGDKVDPLSAKESRMASFDDGRFLASRNSDVGGPFSERMLGKDSSHYDQTASSSSLLWAPSTSRSSRSRRG